jgi:hypothetical protein
MSAHSHFIASCLVWGMLGCAALRPVVKPEVSDGSTWEDSTTGLVWQVAPAETPMDWKSAKKYCQNNKAGLPGSGWRLPDIQELSSLIRGCPAIEAEGGCSIVTRGCVTLGCRNKACDGCAVMKGPRDGCYWGEGVKGICEEFWSSSSVGNNPNRACKVIFKHGSLHNYEDKGRRIGVRCVLGGRSGWLR